MIVPAFILSLIIGTMLAETRISLMNERGLRASGAVKPPGDVYVAMALLYPASFLVMGVEGIWRASTDVVSAGAPAWAVSGGLLFVAAKALKYWAIATLGPRWSFRVWIQPGRPLERDGPYQYLTHPNYVGVVGELIGTAMMMRARFSGPVMILLFGVILWARIRFENRVLASAAVGQGIPVDSAHERGR